MRLASFTFLTLALQPQPVFPSAFSVVEEFKEKQQIPQSRLAQDEEFEVPLSIDDEGAQDEEFEVPLSIDEEGGNPPVDAPTDGPGCRGSKYMIRDKLEHNSEILVGKDYETSLANQGGTFGSTYHVKNEAGPRAASCTQGFSGGYPCNNVELLSMLDVDELHAALPGGSTGNNLNDIWGWTSTTGREFSIVGLHKGTAFVEITDPYNPIYLGAMAGNGQQSNWRDIKVMDHYALVVSESSGHGMQIFDLEKLLTASGNTLWNADADYNEFGNAHNVFVNEDTGFAYAVGTNTCNQGLHIVDVNNPLSPTFAGCFSSDGYTHDVQCVLYDGPDSNYLNKEICFCSNENSITIVDVTDKSSTQLVSRITYAQTGYTHQGWLTEDKSYFLFGDELDEVYGYSSKTRTHIMNVKDLTNMIYSGFHQGRTAAIDHNLYVKENLIYQANYRAGLNVLRRDGETGFEEVGYFDIFPNSDSNNFNGAWSTFPYHSSGVVTVSGIEQGLFVLRYVPGSTTAPVPVTPVPTTSPVVTTPVPTKQPSPWFCGDGVCQVTEGEGCGVCPSDCSFPTNCGTVTNNGSALQSSITFGLVFDATVGSRSLYFYEFQVYLMKDATATIYMKNGSHSSDPNLDNWTEVFDGSISKGGTSRQNVPFQSRFFAQAGSTVAFYISYTEGAAFAYSRDSFANDDITIQNGNALSQQTGNTIPSTSFPGRYLLELIRYDYGTGSTLAPVPSTPAPVPSTPAPVPSTSAPVASPTSNCSCCDEARGKIDDMEEKMDSGLDDLEAMIQNIVNIIGSGSTSAPVASPASAPVDSPTSAPVASPTPAPIDCTDRTGTWRVNGTGNKRNWCNWAKGAPTNRCRNKNLYNDCPKTCTSACS